MRHYGLQPRLLSEITPGFPLSSGALHGPNMLGFVTSAVTEVDRLEDFEYLEYQLANIKNHAHDYLVKNFKRED